MFKIGNLPKDVYMRLKDLTQKEGITYRQAIIAGLILIYRLGANDPDTARGLFTDVKDKYPTRERDF